MVKDPQLRDLLAHIDTGDIHKVVQVNEHFGWFETENTYTGKKRIYNMGTLGNISFAKLTKEEVVDFYLRQAKDRVDAER